MVVVSDRPRLTNAGAGKSVRETSAGSRDFQSRSPGEMLTRRSICSELERCRSFTDAVLRPCKLRQSQTKDTNATILSGSGVSDFQEDAVEAQARFFLLP